QILYESQGRLAQNTGLLGRMDHRIRAGLAQHDSPVEQRAPQTRLNRAPNLDDAQIEVLGGKKLARITEGSLLLSGQLFKLLFLVLFPEPAAQQPGKDLRYHKPEDAEAERHPRRRPLQ